MAITVKQLIEHLKTLPEDLEVIMSKDSEGNGYHPVDLGGVILASMEPDQEYWIEEVGIYELTLELQKEGFSEEDVYEQKVVLISP